MALAGPRSLGRPLGGFFFQAEDGIRDKLVTGVQTCALPICAAGARAGRPTLVARAGPVEEVGGAGVTRPAPRYPGRRGARPVRSPRRCLSHRSSAPRRWPLRRPPPPGRAHPWAPSGGVARGALARQEARPGRSEEHTSELQSLAYLVCRLLLEKKKKT